MARKAKLIEELADQPGPVVTDQAPTGDTGQPEPVVTDQAPTGDTGQPEIIILCAPGTPIREYPVLPGLSSMERGIFSRRRIYEYASEYRIPAHMVEVRN